MTDIWQKPDSSLTICRYTVLLQTCSCSIFYKCHLRKATKKKRIRNRSGKPHSVNQALVINIVPGWFSILTAMTTELQRCWSRPLSCTHGFTPMFMFRQFVYIKNDFSITLQGDLDLAIWLMDSSAKPQKLLIHNLWHEPHKVLASQCRMLVVKRGIYRPWLGGVKVLYRCGNRLGTLKASLFSNWR